MILDFRTLEPPDSPNWHLACPPGWDERACKAVSPVYEIPVERLKDSFVTLVESQPRSRLLRVDEAAMQAEFQQKSAVFGFVDVIVVEFVALGEARASLAIYSRSLTGYYDFGVNKSRVDNWLAALSEALR